MFTGIITNVGVVVEREMHGDLHLAIACSYPSETIEIGASIACSGVCLTVTSRVAHNGGSIFTIEASGETTAKSTLGDWKKGTRINLERSLRAGDELGGHLVSGHVDCAATILSIEPEGDSRRFRFVAPDEFSPLIATKGSIALNGTSLTVNDVDGPEFGINIISHTLTVTTWGDCEPGEKVNLEVDLLARYVARLLEERNK